MINYTEKGPALHDLLYTSGYLLPMRDNIFVPLRTDGQPITQVDIDTINQIIADYDPLPLAQAEKIAELEEETERRISEIVPASRKTKMLFAAVVLMNRREKGAPKAGDAAKITAIETIGDQIEAIHEAADLAEEAINNMTDWLVVQAYDVVIEPGWPA